MDGFPSLAPSRRRSSCRTALLFGIALSILCAGIGCGDFTLFGDEDSNQSPTAVASADKETPSACAKDTVALDGTESSDPNGDSLTYQWAFTQRPTGSTSAIQSATLSQASFKPDKAGAYTIELTVEDDGGLSGTDSVTVTAGSGPVADAGADQQVSLGATVSLDGGESVNPEQDCSTDELTFSWSLSDPDGIESDIGTGEQGTFTAQKEGTYTATLEVARGTDTDSDQVEIEVGETALQALQSGPYEFTVVTINDGIFDGLFGSVLPPGTTLDETVDIPSWDEVPVTMTISLNLAAGASVELQVQVDQANPLDDFYTLTGTGSGDVTVCAMVGDCDGELVPESTTTVSVSIALSNPVLTGFLCGSVPTDTEGTIQLTLSGELQ